MRLGFDTQEALERVGSTVSTFDAAVVDLGRRRTALGAARVACSFDVHVDLRPRQEGLPSAGS